jgi:hypothetical protein
MEGIPNLDIPRLQDLLSELIDDLTGPYRERVLGFFSEFDQTLSQNKTSIQNSIGNIVRAQLRLAEQCRPFFHKLVASQSRDTNIPGDTSRTMHTLSDHDTRDSGHCTSPSMPGKLLFFYKYVISPCVLLIRIKYSDTFFPFIPRSSDSFSWYICFCWYFTS